MLSTALEVRHCLCIPGLAINLMQRRYCIREKNFKKKKIADITFSKGAVGPFILLSWVPCGTPGVFCGVASPARGGVHPFQGFPKEAGAGVVRNASPASSLCMGLPKNLLKQLVLFCVCVSVFGDLGISPSPTLLYTNISFSPLFPNNNHIKLPSLPSIFYH